MRDGTIDVDVAGIPPARLNLYHRCPAFACGSATGPGYLALWWAERDRDTWSFRWVCDNPRVQAPLEGVIVPLLDPTPDELVVAAMNARAEAPDL